MLNTRTFSFAGMAAALMLAGAAHAASTDPVGNGSDYPAYPASTSTLTRAQVQAELFQAQKDGTMPLRGDRINTYRGQQPTSTLTREQVRNEAAAALRAGLIPEGEQAFGE